MKRYLWILVLFLSSTALQAQDPDEQDSTDKLHFRLDAMAIGTANNQVPFWMRTNQSGSIPEYGASGSLVASVIKQYKEDGPAGSLDWAGGIEGRFNAGRKVNFKFIEAYLKVKLHVFQLKAGRSRDYTGLADPDLSAGNFSISGNAVGIPKIELSIPDYTTVPFTGNIVAVKGSVAYGWMGNVNIDKARSLVPEAQAFYHQKSLYLKLGKPDWKVKLYGGLNHQAMWADEKKMYGARYGLSSLETFLYVTSGKTYGNDSLPRSKIGNHLGSLDQAISIEFPGVLLNAYHQFFYEVGGLYHLNNIKDGLWGISITNKSEKRQSIGWHKFLLEFMYSKSQGGEAGAKITPSGDEDYYNNYLYVDGWTYEEENLGNNFMTNKKYQRKELPQQSYEYIGNNRILLLHAGAQVNYRSWDVTAKLSYSMNYGTYATSPVGVSTGGVRQVFDPPYFSKVNQCSGYLEASRPLKRGYSIGFVLAADYGDLLYNSVGGMVRFSKKW